MMVLVVDVASGRYYVIRKGQREHNRARRFNCVLDCPFGAEQSQGTRRHNCHEGQSSPGGDKAITDS
jgi:hypothetical protein